MLLFIRIADYHGLLGFRGFDRYASLLQRSNMSIEKSLSNDRTPEECYVCIAACRKVCFQLSQECLSNVP